METEVTHCKKTGKQSFPTASEAMRRGNRLKGSHAYRCEKCSMWHLARHTTPPSAKRLLKIKRMKWTAE